MKTRMLEIEQTPLAMQTMWQLKPVREAAAMLALARTGVEFEDEAFESVCGNLAVVAGEFCASPDDIQLLLQAHEVSYEQGGPF